RRSRRQGRSEQNPQQPLPHVRARAEPHAENRTALHAGSRLPLAVRRSNSPPESHRLSFFGGASFFLFAGGFSCAEAHKHKISRGIYNPPATPFSFFGPCPSSRTRPL